MTDFEKIHQPEGGLETEKSEQEIKIESRFGVECYHASNKIDLKIPLTVYEKVFGVPGSSGEIKKAHELCSKIFTDGTLYPLGGSKSMDAFTIHFADIVPIEKIQEFIDEIEKLHDQKE